MEQCEDMQQFRYGNKVKTLWSKTSRQECEGSLAAMRTVVEDVLARLNVDFHVNDLYMMFHCMNLDEWHEALTLAASQGSSSNSRLFALHRAARRLCHGLRVQEASEAAWLEVITAVLKHRTAIRQSLSLEVRRTSIGSHCQQVDPLLRPCQKRLDRIKPQKRIQRHRIRPQRLDRGHIEHHLVINGASDLLHEIFGKTGDGFHARSALGFASLPTGVAVEVEAIFEIKD
jgi:hypothetical protein